MNTHYYFGQGNHIRLLDHSNKKEIFTVPNRAITSFAIDDAIATTVGDKKVPPTVRFWVHNPTIVLGIPDSRLPYIEDGIQFVKEQQTDIIIRNSGGLAVYLDGGVLNMSVIVPNDHQLNIHEGYDMMYEFIQQLFKAYTSDINAYEIIGSYCPGDYDLSINGIKFAGISQRRVRNGVAIQIYIDVSGDSHKRAGVVKEFYSISKKDVETKHHYPDINPLTMGTISELLNHSFTVPNLIQDIKALLLQSYTLSSESFHHQEEELFQKRLEQMYKRNEKLTLS